jgi:hypothetical protein
MTNYFYDRLKSDETQKEVRLYLDFADNECRRWHNDFVENILHKPDECMQPAADKLIDLYHEVGAASLMVHGGRFYELFLNGVMENALTDCKSILRECYSDSLMVLLLDMSEMEYLEPLLFAFQKRDEQMAIKGASPKLIGGDNNDTEMDVARIICAMICVKTKNGEYKKLLKPIDYEDMIKTGKFELNTYELLESDAVKEIAGEAYHLIIKLRKTTTVQRISDALKELFIDENLSNSKHELFMTISIALPYLLRSMAEMKAHMENAGNDIKSSHDNLQLLYRSVKESERMEQLATFLKWGCP